MLKSSQVDSPTLEFAMKVPTRINSQIGKSYTQNQEGFQVSFISFHFLFTVLWYMSLGLEPNIVPVGSSIFCLPKKRKEILDNTCSISLGLLQVQRFCHFRSQCQMTFAAWRGAVEQGKAREDGPQKRRWASCPKRYRRGKMDEILYIMKESMVLPVLPSDS